MADQQKMTLASITDELTCLVDSAMMLEEGTPEREEADEMIRRVLTLQLKKADGVAEWFRRTKHEIAYIKTEEQRLADRRARFEGSVRRMTDYVRYVINQAGALKIEGALSTISVRPGGESVDITDIERIPAEYITVREERTPRKDDIKRSLREGRAVPGARLKRGPDSVIVS